MLDCLMTVVIFLSAVTLYCRKKCYTLKQLEIQLKTKDETNVSRGHQRHTYFKEKKQQYSSLENIGSTFNNVKNKNIVQLQYFYRQSLFFNSVRINFNNNVNLWLGSQLSG